MSHSLRKQPPFRDATAGFPAKWLLKNERRNSIQMTRHYPNLVLLFGLKQISHVARPIRSITQIWVVPHLQYEISALVFQPSFRKGTSGGITKWRLFFQATRAKENPFFQPVFEVCKTKVYCYPPPPPTLLVGSLVHCRVASSSVYRLHRFIHLGEERLWSKVFVGERMWPQKILINGSKFEVWC